MRVREAPRGARIVRVMAGGRGVLTLSSRRVVLLDRPSQCRVQAPGEVVRGISLVTSVASWVTRFQFARRRVGVRKLLLLQLDRRVRVRAGVSPCLVISVDSLGT